MTRRSRMTSISEVNCSDAIESELLQPKASAWEAEDAVPSQEGYYSILLKNPHTVDNDIGKYVGSHNIIYLGIATDSLHTRLTRQALRHKSPATFFRSIGAVLGYRPLCGSLAGRANQHNYKFSSEDTKKIIDWINRHLQISWVAVEQPLASVKKNLIRRLQPILNSTGNPSPLPGLAELRRECRAIACLEPKS